MSQQYTLQVLNVQAECAKKRDNRKTIINMTSHCEPAKTRA